jgi:GxxExxY protein
MGSGSSTGLTLSIGGFSSDSSRHLLDIKTSIIYVSFSDQQTYQIIGAAIEVHKELGRGFLEAVYQEALELEFSDRGIPFQSQLELPIFYKGKKLKTHHRSDFVCYDDIIVELKALARLGDGELAQVLNCLKASRRTRALLMNFGSKSLQHERLIWSHSAESFKSESTDLQSQPSA